MNSRRSRGVGHRAEGSFATARSRDSSGSGSWPCMQRSSGSPTVAGHPTSCWAESHAGDDRGRVTGTEGAVTILASDRLRFSLLASAIEIARFGRYQTPSPCGPLVGGAGWVSVERMRSALLGVPGVRGPPSRRQRPGLMSIMPTGPGQGRVAQPKGRQYLETGASAAMSTRRRPVCRARYSTVHRTLKQSPIHEV